MKTVDKVTAIVAFMNNILNSDIDIDPFVEKGCDEEEISNGSFDQYDLEMTLDLGPEENNVAMLELGEISVIIVYDEEEIVDILFVDMADADTAEEGSVQLLLSAL